MSLQRFHLVSLTYPGIKIIGYCYHPSHSFSTDVWARDTLFSLGLSLLPTPTIHIICGFFPKDHGDHVLLTESRMGNAGGLVMLGRSDGVL